MEIRIDQPLPSTPVEQFLVRAQDQRVVRVSGMSELDGRHRVVVVGGGFGGLQAVRSLRRAPVEVTLIDRRNFHLFQPLLYQVATGALSPDEIATPLRVILKRQKNVRVVMGEVRDFDLDRRRLMLGALANGDDHLVVPYDTLIIGGGSRYSYFGHDEWRPFALETKSLESALAVRRRIFTAFEAAEIEQDMERREAWLTFVVVDGGPTGVEMAGQIAELARDSLARDFRSVDPRRARILLIEASERLLPTFPPRLSARARRSTAVVVQLEAEHLHGQMLSIAEEPSKTVTSLWPDGYIEGPELRRECVESAWTGNHCL